MFSRYIVNYRFASFWGEMQNSRHCRVNFTLSVFHSDRGGTQKVNHPPGWKVVKRLRMQLAQRLMCEKLHDSHRQGKGASTRRTPIRPECMSARVLMVRRVVYDAMRGDSSRKVHRAALQNPCRKMSKECRFRWLEWMSLEQFLGNNWHGGRWQAGLMTMAKAACLDSKRFGFRQEVPAGECRDTALWGGGSPAGLISLFGIRSDLLNNAFGRTTGFDLKVAETHQITQDPDSNGPKMLICPDFSQEIAQFGNFLGGYLLDSDRHLVKIYHHIQLRSTSTAESNLFLPVLYALLETTPVDLNTNVGVVAFTEFYPRAIWALKSKAPTVSVYNRL
ncbi:hypothetical protein DFH06DRAFT_1143678 [Mycena polygramma]|nr:hypothetical protein DFH06DRAFT_1143678 [Mycena polygramma]